jgi:murein DD-endopeptidase MepM/ murein hydrolase activator NlpD
MRRAALAPAVTLAVAAGSLLPAPGPAPAAQPWLRPVPGAVVRPFDPPRTPYGAGHRGADFAAAPGSPVRAAGPGTVTFAGTVAGARHVTVAHAGGLRTSYSFLASVRVRAGERVERGDVVGTAGGGGPNHGRAVVHLGLRIGDDYLDPMRLFRGAAPPPTVHLAPLGGVAAGRLEPGAEAEAEAMALLAGLPPPPDYPLVCARWAGGWCA